MNLEPGGAAAAGLHRYVRLVVTALGTAQDGFCVDLAALASAYIAVERRIPALASWDFALVWDECDGWAAAIETGRVGADTANDLVVLSYLGNDVLPAPRLVAQYAFALLHGERRGQPQPPTFRTVATDDDLEQRLIHYASPL